MTGARGDERSDPLGLLATTALHGKQRSGYIACGPMDDPVRLGDRFRITRDAEFHVTFAQYAPAHTVGSRRRIPKGTVLVAFDQQPEASAFNGYPERYDELEGVLVPASERESPGYAGGYAVTMYSADIGGLLERIEPANPRPTENRLPRLSRLGSRPD